MYLYLDVFISVGNMLGVELLGHVETDFLGNLFFPTVAAPFYIPTSNV